MTAVDVVQRQLDAYNAHDLARFAATYSETIRIFRMPSSEPAISGKAQLAQFYGTQRFHLQNLHAELVARIAVGNKIIDHERITGLGEQTVEAAAIYEVIGGLIQTVWFFAPESS